MLLLCYCQRRDRCYYCVIVTGGIGVLLLCYCQRRDRCYYCVIVREGIGVIIVLLS